MNGWNTLQTALIGKSLLIFDFDGTLADTSPLHAAAFSQALRPYDVAVNYPEIAGFKTSDALRHCFTHAGKSFTDADLRELTATKQHLVRQLITERLEPLPGVDDLLRWARTRYRLAMYTSGSRGTVKLSLAKLGYTGWFDPVVFGEDVQRGKPDPEGFLRAMNLAGAITQEVLVFEDSDAGVDAARAANLDFLDVRMLKSYLVSNENG